MISLVHHWKSIKTSKDEEWEILPESVGSRQQPQPARDIHQWSTIAGVIQFLHWSLILHDEHTILAEGARLYFHTFHKNYWSLLCWSVLGTWNKETCPQNHYWQADLLAKDSRTVCNWRARWHLLWINCTNGNVLYQCQNWGTLI